MEARKRLPPASRIHPQQPPTLPGGRPCPNRPDRVSRCAAIHSGPHARSPGVPCRSRHSASPAGHVPEWRMAGHAYPGYHRALWVRRARLALPGRTQPLKSQPGCTMAMPKSVIARALTHFSSEQLAMNRHPECGRPRPQQLRKWIWERIETWPSMEVAASMDGGTATQELRAKTHGQV